MKNGGQSLYFVLSAKSAESAVNLVFVPPPPRWVHPWLHQIAKLSTFDWSVRPKAVSLQSGKLYESYQQLRRGERTALTGDYQSGFEEHRPRGGLGRIGQFDSRVREKPRGTPDFAASIARARTTA